MEALNLNEPVFGNIPLHLVVESKTNPRKKFNEDSLSELANSIRHHGVCQPILVRPLAGTDDKVEIIAGARRYRASLRAERESIPAIVRNLSDEEVIQIQVIENLQREDVHPIEEAEGYKQLMDEFAYSADKLAEQVGKSRAYIYGRLKLCALVPEAREAFYAGKINASIAEKIARMPVAELQAKATADIVGEDDEDPMSFREACGLLQRRYMLKLVEAPFDTKDSKLVKAAGACTACPKLSGNQPLVYSDVDADICTDPDCFASKTKASTERIVAAARKKNIPVYEGDEAIEIYESGDDVTLQDGIYRFDRIANSSHCNKDLVEVLSKEQLPEPKAYVVIDDKPEPLYEPTAVQLALEKAGICLTKEEEEARRAELASNSSSGKSRNSNNFSLSERDAKRAEARVRQDAAAEKESAIRTAIHRAIRETVKTGFNLDLMRLVLKELNHHLTPPEEALADVYEFDVCSSYEIDDFIDSASLEQLNQMLVDMLFSRTIEVNYCDVDEDGKVDFDDEDYQSFVAAAQATGVDAAAIRAELTPQLQEKPAEEKKPAAKNGKKAKADPQDSDTITGDGSGTPLPPFTEENAKEVKTCEGVAPKKPGRKKKDNAAAAWPFPTAAELAKTEAAA